MYPPNNTLAGLLYEEHQVEHGLKERAVSLQEPVPSAADNTESVK
jgi:hypothetical protein